MATEAERARKQDACTAPSAKPKPSIFVIDLKDEPEPPPDFKSPLDKLKCDFKSPLHKLKSFVRGVLGFLASCFTRLRAYVRFLCIDEIPRRALDIAYFIVFCITMSIPFFILVWICYFPDALNRALKGGQCLAVVFFLPFGPITLISLGVLLPCTYPGVFPASVFFITLGVSILANNCFIMWMAKTKQERGPLRTKVAVILNCCLVASLIAAIVAFFGWIYLTLPDSNRGLTGDASIVVAYGVVGFFFLLPFVSSVDRSWLMVQTLLLSYFRCDTCLKI